MIGRSSGDGSPFLRYAVMACAVALFFVFLGMFAWYVAYVPLVLFGGILFAVFLNGCVRLMNYAMPLPVSMPRSLGILLVLLFAAGLAGLTMWAGGTRLVAQFGSLSERLPQVIDSVQQALSGSSWGQMLLPATSKAEEALLRSYSVTGSITGSMSEVMGVMADAIVAFFVGVYLALNPRLYTDSALKLVPKRHRADGRKVTAALGHALRWWFVGRLTSMAIVGILTAVGLWAVGVPLAFALGLIAALLSFVPYIGPILAAVPGVLMATAKGPIYPLYALLVYFGVQFMESYLITPLIQKKVVSLPPAILISAQLVMGVLAGAIGVLFAAPLVVVVIVLVQLLYVEDVLEESTMVLGEGSKLGKDPEAEKESEIEKESEPA